MKAAIMGYGTIGSGVAKILRENKDRIVFTVGEEIELKYVLDLRDFPGDPEEDKLIKDYKIIAEDPEVRLVVETMGGVEPAYTFVNAMLEAGKHVTTSNKALVAAKGAELIETARNHNVNFEFEASVGGGIPIIRAINTCLTGDVVEEISGIVNGTTNYMLTKMMNEGAQFDDVLKEAQANGFAEKDPTADIEGHDACRKIAILTSLVAGQQVDFEDIETEGISHITAEDIKYAKAMGRTIKLLARSKKEGDTYVARVAPYLLSTDNTLYHIDGVLNAVLVKGNMLGYAMFTGSGAGSLPTASAVVADLCDMAKHEGINIKIRWKKEKLNLADASKQKNEYFVRAKDDKEKIKEIFGDVNFVDAGLTGENGFITGTLEEDIFTEKKAKLSELLQVIRLG